jgi:uncharacterized protein YkwD
VHTTIRQAIDPLRSTLARVTVLALLAVTLVALAPAAATAATYAAAEQDFVARINAARGAGGLGPLVVNTQLVRVARDWSAVMAAEDRMYHNPVLGQQVTGDWTRLGENVGYTARTGATQAELVERLHNAFMDSPPHRDNVLGDYNQVGVGITITPAGKLWVTVNFMQAATVQAVDQVDEAIRVSRDVFANAGSGSATAGYVVLTRAEVFADALGGAGLAGRSAPILYTPGPSPADGDPALHPATRAEIDRVLGAGGRIYVLGGTAAVSERAAAELAAAGYDVRRLSGAGRVETSVRIAREILAVHGNTGEVLIARADDWPDAVTGGAYAASAGAPLVLTDRGRLHPAVAAFLAEANPTRRWALGGTAALADEVVTAAGAQRISGADRTATAVAVAERLWGRTAARPGDRYVSLPASGATAWAYALAYAPWSAVNDGPQLLVGSDVPASVRTYLQHLGYGGGVAGDVWAASIVPAPVVDNLRALVRG